VLQNVAWRGVSLNPRSYPSRRSRARENALQRIGQSVNGPHPSKKDNLERAEAAARTIGPAFAIASRSLSLETPSFSLQ
jgi:hypothetical protein